MIFLDELSKSVPSYAPIFLACLVAGFYLQRRRWDFRNSRKNPIAPLRDNAPGGESSELFTAHPVLNPSIAEWWPRQFSYPEITPKVQSLAELKEIPYRPFRPGAYQ